MMLKFGMWLSSAAAAMLLSGCASQEVKPNDTKIIHDSLTIAEAEHIVDERNKQVVLDVNKIARVSAILTKRVQSLEERVSGVSNESKGIKGNTDDIYILKRELADLRDLKIKYEQLQKDMMELKAKQYIPEPPKAEEPKIAVKEEVKPKDEPKQTPPKKSKKKKTKLNAPAVPVEEFEDVEGRVVVTYKDAFTRAAPNTTTPVKAEPVHAGDVFTYTGESKRWYRLKSGLYISKKVVKKLKPSDLTTTKGDNAKVEPKAKQAAPVKPSTTTQPKGIVNGASPLPSTAKVHDIIKPSTEK